MFILKKILFSATLISKTISELQSVMTKNYEFNKSIQKPTLIQLNILNYYKINRCIDTERLDQNFQVLMESDSKMRNFTMQIPVLQPAFI